MTTEGITLFCPKSVRTDRILPCEVLLPMEIDGQDRLKFDAASIWCAKDDKLDLYATGLHIRRIGRKDTKLIAATIEELGSRP